MFSPPTSLCSAQCLCGMTRIREVKALKKVLFGTPSNSPQGGELKISSFLQKQWFYMFLLVLMLQNH